MIDFGRIIKTGINHINNKNLQWIHSGPYDCKKNLTIDYKRFENPRK